MANIQEKITTYAKSVMPSIRFYPGWKQNGSSDDAVVYQVPLEIPNVSASGIGSYRADVLFSVYSRSYQTLNDVSASVITNFALTTGSGQWIRGHYLNGAEVEDIEPDLNRKDLKFVFFYNV